MSQAPSHLTKEFDKVFCPAPSKPITAWPHTTPNLLTALKSVLTQNINISFRNMSVHELEIVNRQCYALLFLQDILPGDAGPEQPCPTQWHIQLHVEQMCINVYVTKKKSEILKSSVCQPNINDHTLHHNHTMSTLLCYMIRTISVL